MSATVVNLSTYREQYRANKRPWSSMDDLPDITPAGQAEVRKYIWVCSVRIPQIKAEYEQSS